MTGASHGLDPDRIVAQPLFSSLTRDEAAEFASFCEVRHVDDKRVEARPPFRRVDSRDRFGVGGVGGEAVDGLGRQDDEAAAGQGLCGHGVGRAAAGAQARRALSDTRTVTCRPTSLFQGPDVPMP